MANTYSNLSVLRRLRIFNIACRPCSVFAVRWSSPPYGCLKINSDGAVRDAPSIAGAGSVFRDHLRHSILSFAAPLGIKFAFEVELCAVMIAVNKAVDLRPLCLWIECDSSYVVHLLRRRNPNVPWHFCKEW